MKTTVLVLMNYVDLIMSMNYVVIVNLIVIVNVKVLAVCIQTTVFPFR